MDGAEASSRELAVIAILQKRIFFFVSAFYFYAITSRMAQQSRQRTFCVSKSGVIIAGADLGGSSSYSSEAALQE